MAVGGNGIATVQEAADFFGQFVPSSLSDETEKLITADEVQTYMSENPMPMAYASTPNKCVRYRDLELFRSLVPVDDYILTLQFNQIFPNEVGLFQNAPSGSQYQYELIPSENLVNGNLYINFTSSGLSVNLGGASTSNVTIPSGGTVLLYLYNGSDTWTLLKSFQHQSTDYSVIVNL